MHFEKHNDWDGYTKLLVRTYANNAHDFCAYVSSVTPDHVTKLRYSVIGARSRAQAKYHAEKWVVEQEFEFQLGQLKHAPQ